MLYLLLAYGRPVCFHLTMKPLHSAPSSGVVWETQKAHGKRFRAMTSLQCALLERAHQNYENQRMVGANPPARLVLDNKMEVRVRT